jgi:hypothetical protein
MFSLLRFSGNDWCTPAARTRTADVSAPAAFGRGSAIVPFVLCAVLYAIPVIGSVREVTDPDVWWHLRTGQWVIEHGAAPTTDPFSQGGSEKTWMAYSWLFDVVLYLLHQAFGLWGVVLYRAAASVAVTAAVHRLIARRVPRFLPAFLLTATVVVTFVPLMNERTWLLTFLFSTLTLDAVLELRDRTERRTIWLLPLMFVVWANVHIQFVYGLGLLCLACVAVVIDGLLGMTSLRRLETPRFATWWKLMPLTIACAAATLVNPYSYHLYAVVWDYATQTQAYRIILEFGPLEFREAWEWLVLALFGFAAFTLGRRAQLSTFHLLLLAGTALLAFRHRRDVWFLVLSSAAIVTMSLGKGTEGQVAEFPLTWRRMAFLFGLVGVMVPVVAFQQHLTNQRLEQEVAATYPVEAVRVIETRGDVGPVFNHFNWGGYLAWRLPRLPVSLDGRTNLHGDAKILRCSNTWAGGTGWENDPDLVAANVVIAEKDMVMTDLLRKDPRFALIHEDGVALVFVRHRPEPAQPDGLLPSPP